MKQSVSLSHNLLDVKKQALLFSLGLKINDIVHIKHKSMIYSAYYCHFQYNKPQELSALIKKFNSLKMRPKICTNMVGIETKFYTVILVYIPQLYIKYLMKGPSESMKLRNENDEVMIF